MSEWIDTSKRLPDADTTVLMAMADGEVWVGFIDDEQWRYVSGDPTDVVVTHWMDLPAHPFELEYSA